MKVSFVGKGGSGKSTTTALFVDYLKEKGTSLITVDADINIHLPNLLGFSTDSQKALSDEKNSLAIKKFLKGSNSRIKQAEEMVKTTPPGSGSNFLTLSAENELIQKYAQPFSQKAYLMHVGTYQEEGIGDSCYHTNLSIFETLLSHTLLKEEEWLVADMVAGTDAFAGSLHAQFDAVFLIVEPTPEGVGVFKQYKELSQVAGVFESVYVIGNKIEDEEDVEFLQNHVGDKLIGVIKKQAALKRARQQGKPVSYTYIDNAEELFGKVIELATEHNKNEDDRIAHLHELHKKHSTADYIIAAHGDVSDQIDPDFTYSSMKQ